MLISAPLSPYIITDAHQTGHFLEFGSPVFQKCQVLSRIMNRLRRLGSKLGRQVKPSSAGTNTANAEPDNNDGWEAYDPAAYEAAWETAGEQQVPLSLCFVGRALHNPSYISN